MKRLLFLALALFSFPYLCIAKEPFNLACVKKELIRYHDSGEYEKDIDQVITQAIGYMQTRLQTTPYAVKKPAIIMDIDETVLSSYPLMVKLDFGMLKPKFREFENQVSAPRIAPTLKLYQYAKEHNVAVFFITGRPEFQRAITAKNLQKAGYAHWDGILFKTSAYKGKSDWVFKSSMRKKVMSRGYHILLNIGDQTSDLIGGYADKTFKLPNPFYMIPRAY